MFQETSFILILSFFIVFLAFMAGVILFVRQAKKNRVLFTAEKDLMKTRHEQELLQAQLDIQQQTMQHIGTEIHDNVGQKLTLASLYAKQLTAGNITGRESKVEEVGKIIDESLTELRQLSKTLTNPELAKASLLNLLKEEAKRVNLSGVCHISVQHGGNDVILPQAAKNILFRLLQEFIQNSLKHSGCRNIIINMKADNKMLYVKAMDDGKGFDQGSVSSGGIGLETMKKRAGQLNAVYSLTSEPGKGTTLSLQLSVNT